MKTTIFLPISRPERLKPMIKQVADMKVDTHTVDFFIVADNTNISLSMVLDAIKEQGCEKKFLGLHLTGFNAAPEGNIARRRERIANVFNIARTHIPEDSDFVFCLEDDTNAKPNAYLHLWGTYKTINDATKKKIGFVSGLQVGRWGFKMIGAWRSSQFTSPEEPIVVETIPFALDKIIEKVDAAGLYCFIVPRKLFVDTEFRVSYFGCDVNFGFDLREKGYQHFIDWTVQTGHAIPTGALYPDEKCVVVKYIQDGDTFKRVEP